MWDELRLRLCKCPEGRRQVKGKKKKKEILSSHDISLQSFDS